MHVGSNMSEDDHDCFLCQSFMHFTVIAVPWKTWPWCGREKVSRLNGSALYCILFLQCICRISSYTNLSDM